MRSRSYENQVLLVGLVLWGGIGSMVSWAADQRPAPSPKLTCQEMEAFLRTADIGPQRNVPKGVTLPKQATLDDGKVKHDAVIGVKHETKTSFTTARGTELNFKDWWEFNVAGYELAKILDLNMVPPYVERKVGGTAASLTWLVDDAIMEVDRIRRKLEPPDVQSWKDRKSVV